MWMSARAGHAARGHSRRRNGVKDLRSGSRTSTVATDATTGPDPARVPRGDRRRPAPGSAGVRRSPPHPAPRRTPRGPLPVPRCVSPLSPLRRRGGPYARPQQLVRAPGLHGVDADDPGPAHQQPRQPAWTTAIADSGTASTSERAANPNRSQTSLPPPAAARRPGAAGHLAICCSASCRRTRWSTSRRSSFSRKDSRSSDSYSGPSSLRVWRVASSSFAQLGVVCRHAAERTAARAGGAVGLAPQSGGCLVLVGRGRRPPCARCRGGRSASTGRPVRRARRARRCRRRPAVPPAGRCRSAWPGTGVGRAPRGRRRSAPATRQAP